MTVQTEPFEGLEEILAKASNLSMNNTATVGGEAITVSSLLFSTKQCHSFEMQADRSLGLQLCRYSLLDKNICIGFGSFQNTGEKKSMFILK